jgi:hypothetical protein
VAEPETGVIRAVEFDRESDRRDVDRREAGADAPLADPPGPVTATQPLAVYLHWSVIGMLGGAYALSYPLVSGVDSIARVLPRWSQVFAAAAIAALLLTALERSRRDRKLAGHGLTAAAALFAGLAVVGDGLLGAQSTRPAWAAVLLASLYGLLHIACLEDWVAGRSGPRFQHLANTLRDVATLPWWFWFSKEALVRRSRSKQRRTKMRDERQREATSRRTAEDRAAKALAERKAAEDAFAAATAAEAAAKADHIAKAEQARADEAGRVAAEAADLRAKAELRVGTMRKETEELRRQAEAAALERTRLRAEQLEAERRFLEAAVAAQAAAEKAAEVGVEAVRAQALLERIQAEVAVPPMMGRAAGTPRA